MGLGLAMAICVAIFLIVGFMVFQARFAAKHWRRVIAEGDAVALDQLLDDTFEAWRRERPKRGTPPADWRARTAAPPPNACARRTITARRGARCPIPSKVAVMAIRLP